MVCMLRGSRGFCEGCPSRRPRPSSVEVLYYRCLGDIGGTIPHHLEPLEEEAE
jgi:hypothetical protein